MPRTIFATPVVTPLLRALAACWLALGRWHVRGPLPALPKAVVVFAPHSSNWDFPTALCAALVLRVQSQWLGKDALFRPLYGWFFRWCGGIPVNRRIHAGLVEASVAAFQGSERQWIALAPEGTRTQVARWKSGFWHIATQAGVPVVLAYIDYARREIGVLDVFRPGTDPEADIAQLQQRYAAFGRRGTPALPAPGAE